MKVKIFFNLILLIIMVILLRATVSAQQVTGTILDNTGVPIIGASVEELGTSNGTVTDIDGMFKLSVANPNASLFIKSLGLTDLTYPLNGSTNVKITMVEDAVLLEQVVVIGYGVQKKSDVTSSISSLKGSEVEKVALPNIEQALQGKVAGVYVSPNSGAPGAGAVIRIRGTGTLNNANPLYVIDGMITYDASMVNPQDVESIEVLKDASAAAIYGSRGANGVIIISTKNGKKSKKTQFAVSTYKGSQELIKEVPVLNGTEFAKAFNALRGQAFYPNPSAFGEGTNWQREITREAPLSNIQLSALGGNENFSYGISGNLFDQKGILNNTSFNRATIRLNQDIKLTKILSLGSNVSYALTKFQNGPNVTTGALKIPSVVTVKDSTGKFSDPTFFGLPVGNPVADQFYKSNNHSNQSRLFGNIFLSAAPIKGLTLKSNFGFDNRNDKSKYFEPQFEVSGSQRNKVDRLGIGRGEEQNWIWEQTANYNKSFGKHDVTVLLGFTAEERSNEFLGASRESFPGNIDELLFLSAGNDTTQMNSGGASDEALVSQLFRVNYAFNSKYFLTASVRGDQSSRFTKDNRKGYFPSMSVGWNIAEESFLKNISAIERFKLRASIGVLGNQAATSRYPTTGVVVGGLYAVFGGGESLNTGATLTSLTNPNLRWETSRQIDFGADVGLFNDQLGIEFDWYKRNTYDIIAPVPIPEYIGSEGSPFVNTAEVLNRGIDLAINYRKAGTLSYNIGGNISPVHNEVVKLAQGKSEIFAGGISGENATRTAPGLPIGAFYGYKVAGVFQSAEEVANSPKLGGEEAGDLRFTDINADGKIDGKDRVYLGSPIPTLTFGFNAGLSYKGIDISADMLGVSGNKVYNAKEVSRFAVFNFEKHVANAWTKETPSKTEPRVTNGGHNYRVSDFFLHDGSFLRLRNVNVGYTIPSNLTSKLKIGSLRVFGSGTNLWTKQKFTGYTPEFPNSGNAYEVGFDYGAYPLAKSIQGGLEIKF
jgi:TonB-linked SusC/RagA family outer membrane protein